MSETITVGFRFAARGTVSPLQVMAYQAARRVHQKHAAQLPPNEWNKRLLRMAQEQARNSCLSIQDCMDHIVECALRCHPANAGDLVRDVASDLVFELQCSGHLPPPLPPKPKPRRFRGRQLKKWPYEWRK